VATIFYLLGFLTIGVGGLSVWRAFSSVAERSNDYATVGALLGSTSGLSVVFGGLLILAIGGVLGRLDRIVENTHRGFNGDTSRWPRADREKYEAARARRREPDGA